MFRNLSVNCGMDLGSIFHMAAADYVHFTRYFDITSLTLVDNHANEIRLNFYKVVITIAYSFWFIRLSMQNRFGEHAYLFLHSIVSQPLTHWCRWRIYASLNWVTLGSDNGLSPIRRHAIIWTNDGMSLIGPLGTHFKETLIKIHTFTDQCIPPSQSHGSRQPGHGWSRRTISQYIDLDLGCPVT